MEFQRPDKFKEQLDSVRRSTSYLRTDPEAAVMILKERMKENHAVGISSQNTGIVRRPRIL